VNFSAGRRRPSRVAAAVLLVILHLAAIELFLGLKATRDRPADRLVTLLLSALTKPAPIAPRTVAKPMKTRMASVVVVPRVAIEPVLSPHEDAVPAAPLQDSTGLAPGAVAPPPSQAPLNLTIPKDFFAHPPPLTPAQEAMRDPRSNRLVLTKQEQMDVDFGVVECIAWQREPDGSIYRGPGHRQRIQGISTNPFTTHKPGQEDRGMECVK
jgi:hypothetical protein